MDVSQLDFEAVKESLMQDEALIKKTEEYFKAVGLDYKAVAAVARNNAQASSDLNTKASTRPSAARMRRRGIAL